VLTQANIAQLYKLVHI